MRCKFRLRQNSKSTLNLNSASAHLSNAKYASKYVIFVLLCDAVPVPISQKNVAYLFSIRNPEVKFNDRQEIFRRKTDAEIVQKEDERTPNQTTVDIS